MVGNRINATAAGDLGNSAIQLSPDGAETVEVPPTRQLNPGTNALRVQSYHSYPNNVLAYDLNRPSGSSYYHRPRGSFKILAIYASDDGGKTPRATGITANDATVYVTFRTVEPIFISPFVFGCEETRQECMAFKTLRCKSTCCLTATGHGDLLALFQPIQRQPPLLK
jgi:hypothetical protein